MYNDYIYHGDHKYLARIKTAANKYRYFYSQKAYDAYKKLGTTTRALKSLAPVALGIAQSSLERKRVDNGRRTDVYNKWDAARRKEYETNAVNATGPGAGQQALNDWNDMVSNFGQAVHNNGPLVVQATQATADSYNSTHWLHPIVYATPHLMKGAKTYGVRPAARKKNVTGNANEGWGKRKKLARFTSRRKAV